MYALMRTDNQEVSCVSDSHVELELKIIELYFEVRCKLDQWIDYSYEIFMEEYDRVTITINCN